jgi:hypothetical protein
MSDKQPMQAAGKGVAEDKDGVGQERVNSRNAGGESGGGAYPNPHTGKEKKQSGFFGHGGQTEIDYSGTGGGEGDTGNNVNGATGSKTD